MATELHTNSLLHLRYHRTEAEIAMKYFNILQLLVFIQNKYLFVLKN